MVGKNAGNLEIAVNSQLCFDNSPIKAAFSKSSNNNTNFGQVMGENQTDKHRAVNKNALNSYNNTNQTFTGSKAGQNPSQIINNANERDQYTDGDEQTDN